MCKEMKAKEKLQKRLKRIFCIHSYKKRIYAGTGFRHDCFVEAWREECVKCGRQKKDFLILPAMMYKGTDLYRKAIFDGVYIKGGKEIK